MIAQFDYYGPWNDRDGLAACLASAGMSPAACAEKAEHFARATAALAAEMPSAGPIRAMFVPGRIEVLGKHTDYAGGQSLVAAAERGFCLAVRARTDRGVRIRDVVRNEQVDFEMTSGLAPPVGLWSNYPMTVARRLAQELSRASRGADIAFASDLPPAAGMSSSSAMMIAVFLALAEVNAPDSRSRSGRTSAIYSTWPAISGRWRTARPSALWREIAGWALSAAARTTRPSSRRRRDN